ncbi:MAG: insulinase family protein [Armatimonadetes bacterium]|nr:insulinase family protein [Armatimonadota bacterium]
MEDPPIPSDRETLVEKDTEQVHFCLGTTGFAHTDDRRYMLAVMDTILGGGMSSRLFQEIREKRGLAYNIGSYSNSYRDAGMVAIYGGTGPEQAGQVMELIRAEIRKIYSEKVSGAELDRAKNQIKSSLIMSQESMISRMSFTGKSELFYGRVIPLKEIIKKVEKATPRDVCAVAEEVFTAHPLVLAAIGPMEETHEYESD